jgi:hypothetical protein
VSLVGGDPGVPMSHNSLKASRVVCDDADCVDCSVYLGDFTALKNKFSSTCGELNMLRVEVAEPKCRPPLLGSCTSCPVLHGKD